MSYVQVVLRAFGVGLLLLPFPRSLTRPYAHLSDAVLAAMTMALAVNKSALCGGASVSNRGYGYLFRASQRVDQATAGEKTYQPLRE